MGSGLAIWDTVIPHAEIDGWDIDISNTANNLPNLKERGAFPGRAPKLHFIDSHEPVHKNMKKVEMVAGSSKYRFFIDDGWHSPEGIANTFETFHQFLDEEGFWVRPHALFIVLKY